VSAHDAAELGLYSNVALNQYGFAVNVACSLNRACSNG
jgi:hypothetical protein